MKPLKRGVAWLGAVCLCLCGLTVFLACYTPRTQTPADASAVESFVQVPLTELAAVMVQNERASFAVMQTPEGPEMVSQITADYDDTQMYALLYAATHLSGRRRNTDQATFADYGIDAPRATVTLMMLDGSERKVQVLMTHPIDQSVYMYDVQGEAIYLVSGVTAELFLRDELEFMSHSPLPLREMSDFSTIRSITMQFDGDARDYQLACTDTGYYLTAPIRQRVPSAVVASQLFVPLLSVYSDSFVAFGANLSDYGFDDAFLRLVLETDTAETELWFTRAEDGACLMARPDTGNVYTVDASVPETLTFDYVLLTGGTALYYGAGDLAQLVFDLADEQFVAEISGEGDTFAVRLNGWQLDAQQRQALFSALNGISLAAEATPQAPLPAASLTITATMRSGAVEVTSFAPAMSGFSYLTVMGETHFAVEDQSLQSLIDVLYELTERNEA